MRASRTEEALREPGAGTRFGAELTAECAGLTSTGVSDTGAKLEGAGRSRRGGCGGLALETAREGLSFPRGRREAGAAAPRGPAAALGGQARSVGQKPGFADRVFALPRPTVPGTAHLRR